MNDWLDYKGSGSGRANLNTLEHAASIPYGGKINAIREKAKESAAKIQDVATYNRINSQLDSLYTEFMAAVSAYKNAVSAENQFITAARNFKAKSVIANTKLRTANDKGWAISNKIEEEQYRGYLSDTQYTALRNKLDNISGKADAEMPSDRTETYTYLETLESVITELNNNSKINFKSRS